jgi:hypothetical protein
MRISFIAMRSGGAIRFSRRDEDGVEGPCAVACGGGFATFARSFLDDGVEHTRAPYVLPSVWCVTYGLGLRRWSILRRGRRWLGGVVSSRGWRDGVVLLVFRVGTLLRRCEPDSGGERDDGAHIRPLSSHLCRLRLARAAQAARFHRIAMFDFDNSTRSFTSAAGWAS